MANALPFAEVSAGAEIAPLRGRRTTRARGSRAASSNSARKRRTVSPIERIALLGPR